MNYSWEVEPLLTGREGVRNISRCFSPSNIALAKYWGKRDVLLNLPSNGSISCTLSKIGTFTTVEFDSSFERDRLLLDRVEQHGSKLEKVSKALDLIRGMAGSKLRARIQTENNFPTGAGLASSASGFSALIFAGSKALGLDLTPEKLSELSRRSSGSACRSFFSGFVEWKRGISNDGKDSVAESLAPSSHWPLRALVCITNEKEKAHASTGGMESTRVSSPYFGAWTEYAERSLPDFRDAIRSKDFGKLANLSEENCLRMHASAMAATPGILYWTGATVELIHLVRKMRSQGLPVFFTIDAGPNVVLFVEEQGFSVVKSKVCEMPGIATIETSLGEGVHAI